MMVWSAGRGRSQRSLSHRQGRFSAAEKSAGLADHRCRHAWAVELSQAFLPMYVVFLFSVLFCLQCFSLSGRIHPPLALQPGRGTAGVGFGVTQFLAMAQPRTLGYQGLSFP